MHNKIEKSIHDFYVIHHEKMAAKNIWSYIAAKTYIDTLYSVSIHIIRDLKSE